MWVEKIVCRTDWKICQDEVQRMPIAEHSIHKGHCIDFSGTWILERKTRYLDSLVKETIELYLNNNSIKRRWLHTEPGFIICDQYSTKFSPSESSVFVLPNQQHTLTDFPKRLETFTFWSLCLPLENVIELCPSESFKNYIAKILMKVQAGPRKKVLESHHQNQYLVTMYESRVRAGIS